MVGAAVIVIINPKIILMFMNILKQSMFWDQDMFVNIVSPVKFFPPGKLSDATCTLITQN